LIIPANSDKCHRYAELIASVARNKMEYRPLISRLCSFG